MGADKRRGDRSNRRETTDWQGVEMVSSLSVKGENHFLYNNYKYCTGGEYDLAILLDLHGIPFTPDVEFQLIDKEPDAVRSWVDYVPDFIFNTQTYLWVCKDGTEIKIHGLEAKARPPQIGYRPSKGYPLAHRLFKKQFLLYEQRGILVPIVSDAEISTWLARGQFPIKPCRRRKHKR